jgi:outer membrane protein assembly factor BamB
MRFFLTAWITCALVGIGHAQWQGFRGPNGTGVSTASGLPDSLDPEHNIAWRTEIPKGYSSPIMLGDRVFLTAFEAKKCFTLALDRNSGEVLWKAEAPSEVPANRRTPNSPVSSTPATDGERVYVAYECYGLVAYDLEGKEVWKKELAPFNIPHGLATSPVIEAGLVIMLADQDTNSYLLALDAKTGAEKWKTPRPGFLHGYSTPAIYHPAEGPTEVIVSGSYDVVGYSAASGEKLWWASGMCWQAKTLPLIEKDVVYVLSAMGGLAEFGGPKMPATWKELAEAEDADKNGLVGKEEWPEGGKNMLWFLLDMDNDDQFSEAEFDQAQLREHSPGGLFAIRLGGRGDVTKTHMLWKFDDARSLPDLPSPVVHDGVVYLFRDNGVLTTLDAADGKVLKNERAGGPDEYSASPVIGDGKIYCAGHSGQILVLRCGKTWELLSTTSLDEEIWATPAIADGQILVRTQDALYSFVKVDG